MAEQISPVEEVKRLALGSVYVLAAFRFAEASVKGQVAVLTVSTLVHFIRSCSSAASATLDRSRDQETQVKKWCAGSVRDGVVSRLAVGGGRAEGGGRSGKQTEYVVTERGRELGGFGGGRGRA